MKKIKILIVIGSLDYSNGITNYAMNYYKKIDKDKFEMDFIVHDKVKNDFVDLIKENGNDIYFLDNISIRKMPIFYSEINKIMKAKKYDIIHCHLLNISFLYFDIAKKNNIKIRIIHSHASKYAEKKSRIFRNMILGKIGISLSTAKFACSKLAGEFLYKNKCYTIINNAIVIDKYRYNNEKRKKVRSDYNLNNEIVIGHIGRFSEQKNHIFLIDLLSELNKNKSNYKLMLLGNGHLMNEIINYSKQKGVYDDILFVGNVHNPYDYYNAFDIFVLPSLFEGLPVVGIEAQANGLPCLFADTITKEVTCNKNVNFLPLNEKEKWKELIHSCKLTRIEKIEQKLEEEYNIDKQTKKIEQEYFSLMFEENK